MITVDNTKCIRCGTCDNICHEHCIALTDNTITINHDLCSTCTQCIAICPQQAISWDGVDPVPYDASNLPSPQQIDELLKQRRTIRFFTKDRIDRELLEEIIGYGMYAPTNNFALRALVVDDEQVIQELDRISMRFVKLISALVFKRKIVFHLIRKLTPALDPKDGVKVEKNLKRGYVLPHPAAVVFIVGDRRIALSVESAQYALYNIILYAQVKGIGTCLWGGGKVMLDRNRRARKMLGLKKHEHILGAVQIGYPAVRFKNKVEGKNLPIKWIMAEA